MKKRMLSLFVAAAMLVSIFGATAVSAASAEWTPPTSPMTVDKNVVTVGSHRAAQTSCEFLGANGVTSSNLNAKDLATGKKTAMLGIFGSDANESPNPYYYNLFYNLYAAENSLTQVDDVIDQTAQGNPFQADTTLVDYTMQLGGETVNYSTSATLQKRPDVLFGITSATPETSPYIDLIANLPENTDADTTNNYDPKLVSYTSGSVYHFSEQLMNMAKAIQQVIDESNGVKKTRYQDDAITIATNYQKYFIGLQMYILSEYEKKGIEKPIVAIVEPVDGDSDGALTAYSTKVSSGTAAVCRGAEYLENTTINIIDKLGIANTGTDEAPAYKVTAAQLKQADYLVIVGIQGTTATEEAFKTTLFNMGLKEEEIAPIYSSLPDTVYGIIMNSTENALGYGVFNGFVAYNQIGLNPVYLAAYFYEKFYHVTNRTALQSAITSNFQDATLPAGVTTDLSDYRAADVEKLLIKCLKWYEKNFSKFAATRLNYDFSDGQWTVDWTRGIGADESAIERIAGETRFGTSALISQELVAENDADAIVIVNGLSFPDALAATPFAAQIDAPILMVNGMSGILDGSVVAEINRIDKEQEAQIYIIGGKGAVSEATENAIKALGYSDIERIAGETRFETAAKIAEKVDADVAFIADGMNYPDALSAGSAAATNDGVILFTLGTQLSKETADFLKDAEIDEAVIIGGEAAIKPAVETAVKAICSDVERISGTDRIDTSVKIAKEYFAKTDVIYFATGFNFADALAGGPLAADNDAPIILLNTAKNSVDQSIIDYIKSSGAKKVVVLGGKAAVSEKIYGELANAIA